VDTEIVRGIGLVVVLGVGLQWLGRRTGIPSIVLLLAGGLAVGPGLGWVDPEQVLGDALFPAVSLAVGLLLFNGGLELDLAELRGGARRPVIRLVVVGALVTWLLTALATHLVFHEPVRVSVLIGAILIVSGPTVVGPLLRLARPTDPSATILRWEGILIDPIGATLGLFCLNAFFVESFTISEIWSELIAVALAGAAVGVAAAFLLVTALRHLLVPDDLEVAVTLMLVVAAYWAAEWVRPEAGLFATTAMGLALANQKRVPMRQVRTFGEPVVALLIGSLFIVLAADVDADALRDHFLGGLVLSAVLVVVVRPVAVALATMRSHLRLRDRAFLACMAPRGIVAASTAALFALRLEAIGQPSTVLVPAVFAVIIALAVVYGVGSIPAARWLGVARPPARGALVLSGAPWARELAAELAGAGLPTLLVARGRADLERPDLPYRVHTGLVHELPTTGLLADVGGAIVASRDDETDLMALSLLSERLGRGHVWVLPSRPADDGDRDAHDVRRLSAVEVWALRPFTPGVTHEELQASLSRGGRVRTVDADAVPEGARPLVRLHDGDWTATIDGAADPGDRMIVLDPGRAGGALDRPHV
jgi:NhaP-type Na+/H+ or K+/H+ antiporter